MRMRFVLAVLLFGLLALLPGSPQADAAKRPGAKKCPAACGGGYGSCYYPIKPPPYCDPSNAAYWRLQKKVNVFNDPCNPGSPNYWGAQPDHGRGKNDAKWMKP